MYDELLEIGLEIQFLKNLYNITRVGFLFDSALSNRHSALENARSEKLENGHNIFHFEIYLLMALAFIIHAPAYYIVQYNENSAWYANLYKTGYDQFQRSIHILCNTIKGFCDSPSWVTFSYLTSNSVAQLKGKSLPSPRCVTQVMNISQGILVVVYFSFWVPAHESWLKHFFGSFQNNFAC